MANFQPFDLKSCATGKARNPNNPILSNAVVQCGAKCAAEDCVPEARYYSSSC